MQTSRNKIKYILILKHNKLIVNKLELIADEKWKLIERAGDYSRYYAQGWIDIVLSPHPQLLRYNIC